MANVTPADYIWDIRFPREISSRTKKDMSTREGCEKWTRIVENARTWDGIEGFSVVLVSPFQKPGTLFHRSECVENVFAFVFAICSSHLFYSG